MRNYWYPKQQAEYLTPERLQALGLTKADIGERDTTFAQYVASEDIAADDEPGDEPASMGVELEALSVRAHPAPRPLPCLPALPSSGARAPPPPAIVVPSD